MSEKTAKRRPISIGIVQRQKVYEQLKDAHAQNLAVHGVKLPEANYSGDTAKESAAALWLIALKKQEGVLVHKDDIAAFVRSILPSLGMDQQVRHLGGDGWNILNTNEKIPGSNQKVPQGYHLLLNTDQPKASFLDSELKRVGRVGARNWEQLKSSYGRRCATCGSPEGKTNFLDASKKTELQMGHMDPSKPQELGNLIPQCQVCNQSYQNEFVFTDKGRTYCVASPDPVLRASAAVKRAVFSALRDDLEKPEMDPLKPISEKTLTETSTPERLVLSTQETLHRCRHGHDLTLPGAVRKNGRCRECRRAAQHRLDEKRVLGHLKS